MRRNPGKVQLRIGRNIRQLRRLHGWSQETLAERVDMTEKHVGRMERGEVKELKVDVLAKVATALEADIADLVRDSPTGRTSSHTYVIHEQHLARMEDCLRMVERIRRAGARRGSSD